MMRIISVVLAQKMTQWCLLIDGHCRGGPEMFGYFARTSISWQGRVSCCEMSHSLSRILTRFL